MHAHCLRIAAIALATLALSGCYVMQAASGQAEVIHRSEPIPSVLANPATPAHTRERLQLVQEARAFAISELALRDGKSYQKYADMGRPYVVHNVVATPEFSVEPRRWCFPVTGCIAYRGYFDEDRARAYGLKLSIRGDDVSVGGVPTYSTLGHLPDPVFGSMLGWRDTRLVGTIFHELAHERLYFADDSEMNEAFASVVEDEGIRRWLQQQGRAGEIVAHEASMARQKEFAALLRDARSRLAQLYASGLPPATMRIEKQREIRRAQVPLRAVARPVGRLCRVRRLVRALAQQRAPGGRRDVRGLRAGTAAHVAGGRFAAGVLRQSRIDPSARRASAPRRAVPRTASGPLAAPPVVAAQRGCR